MSDIRSPARKATSRAAATPSPSPTILDDETLLDNVFTALIAFATGEPPRLDSRAVRRYLDRTLADLDAQAAAAQREGEVQP